MNKFVFLNLLYDYNNWEVGNEKKTLHWTQLKISTRVIFYSELKSF